MLNLLTGKEKYNSINTEVFYECIDTILKKENLRGQVPYSDIPKLIRALSSRKEDITSVKDLINEYKNTPIIRPGDIKNLIKFNPNLIEKRKQDIIDICTWLLPLFRKKEIEPFSINILVAMNSGQGKTLFAECLSEALSKILSLHKGVQRKIGFITMNPDIETTAIDLSNYPSGSIIIIDDMMKTNVANRNANVNFVFVADKKSATSVTSVLKNEIYYTINIEDMNSQDIMEMISNRHTIEDDNVKRDMLFVIEKLIESKVSPKAILNIIELGVEHEKQAQSKRDFLFNPNTIAHLAHKAGVKIGYDFNIEKLREKLLSSVFGQEDAIEMVATSVGMAKYGIRNKNKPVLTALLVGPTGVGKTELSIALSNIMFGTDSIIRLDMGEYTEHHSVSRLIGSPPGYVGYSTDTAFSAALKKNSRRVILFDEIEKAAPEVHQLLLSLLDTGTITLGNGESIDAKDSIIIMTSNALVDKIKKVDIGFNEEKGKSKILSNYRKALEENKIFSPEFLNRIDAVIPFNFLSDEVCTKIVKREIEKMKSSLDMQGYKISIPEEVIQLILNSTQKPFNGRSIVRSVDAIKRLVVMKIIKDKDNNNIVVTAEDVRANPY